MFFVTQIYTFWLMVGGFCEKLRLLSLKVASKEVLFESCAMIHHEPPYVSCLRLFLYQDIFQSGHAPGRSMG